MSNVDNIEIKQKAVYWKRFFKNPVMYIVHTIRGIYYKHLISKLESM